jgi:hypothetical protein
MFDGSLGGWTSGITQKGGFVGIGTVTPGSGISGLGYNRVLDVSASTYAVVNVAGSAAADAAVADVTFSNNAIGGADTRLGVLRFSRKGAVNSGEFDLWTRITGAWINALKISPAGNATFAGTVTGANIQAHYGQDLAEWVPADRELEAGTVVVLNPRKTNEVMRSDRSYDSSVAGVISAAPGIVLGQQGEGKVLVATTGRVRVKVDASRAEICVGDLLVTSDQEGFAMKSQPLDLAGVEIHRPGTLIGKALESLEKGRRGEILVLLSLQ